MSLPAPSDDAAFEALARRASLEVALFLLVALVVSLLIGALFPLALAGPVALGRLVLRLRAFRAPSALPNLITTLRVMLTGAIALAAPEASRTLSAMGVLLVFALDGLDGFVARRSGQTSRQGAHYDMEADAYLVLTVCSLHVLSGLGAWVLLGGLLRYAYVIVTTLVETRGEAPRTRFGRYAFGSSLLALTLALLEEGVRATLLAALGTLIISWSFGRSFAWALRG
jgi:phosphatidylglycerophosphate synthase